MKEWIWGIVVPTTLFSLGLMVFTDRYMEVHRERMRSARDYVWKNKYRNKIGELVCELDDQIELGEKLQEREDYLELLRGGEVDRDALQDTFDARDFPTEIGQQIPYLADIRRLTEDIRDQAGELNQIEGFYDDLTTHRFRIGMTVFSFDVFLILWGLFDYDSELLEDVLLLLIALTIIFTGYQLRRYHVKRKYLRDMASKQEGM